MGTMRYIKMTALAGALACGLALSACASDDTGSTDTTTSDEATGGFGIPLNADGTVDSELFLELTRSAEANITSQIFTNRFVDAETREPLDEDLEATYVDVDPERLYYEEIFEGERFEIYHEDGQTWTRTDGGEWQVDEDALEGTEESEESEAVDEESEQVEEPISSTVEIIDLDARKFRINETYADDEEVYATEVIVDEQMHVTESFVDYGDGTGLLQNTTSINEPVEFPEDLPV